jgi:Inner membrane component of T3SS, cytoplasmic domain/Domain of unknown function (DUF1707)
MAESAGPHGVRASDLERDRALDVLRERFAEGRMSADTFEHRIELVLQARVRSDLTAVLADLPGRAAGRGWLRNAVARIRRLGRRRTARLAIPARPALLFLPAAQQGRFTIGREPSCDMTLGDMTVSRLHASLQRNQDGWLLVDLGSTNGTRLNGWRVTTPSPVRPGDYVSFGDATFVLGDRPAV